MIAVNIIKLWLKLRALRRRQSREGNAVMSKIPQEAIELLPCPFCGEQAERIDIDDGDNAGGSFICCTACQASGNIEFGYKENFVSNWNRRADAARAQGWLFDNEDTGREFLEDHPVESGEVPDATNIVPANAKNLKAELLSTWKLQAEIVQERDSLREIVYTTARAQGAGVAVKRLEWLSEDNGDFVAQSVVGWYHVGLPASYWSCTTPDGRVEGGFESHVDAEIFAQADYEQRIRSALTTPPVQAQGAEVIDLQEYVAQLHQPYVIEEYCVRPHCNGGKPFWAAPVDGWNGNFSKEMALACVASLLASYPSREFRVTPLRSEPDTAPPAPQPTEREQVLEEALRAMFPPYLNWKELTCDADRAVLSHPASVLRQARAALAGGEA